MNKRRPFAGRIHRAVKTVSGRRSTPSVPAHIYESKTNKDRLGEDSRAYIRRKLGMKLGKFADSIVRVTVRLNDINGPRGGRDKVCQVKVVLSGLPSVVVEEQRRSTNVAIDQALSKVEEAVKRQLRRRRQAPLRQSAQRREGLAA